jgi:hypothetical protein
LRHGPSRGKEGFCGVRCIGVIRNSKPVLVIEYWNLRFVCNFSFGVPTLWAGPRFGAWNLIFCNAPSLRQTAAKGKDN